MRPLLPVSLSLATLGTWHTDSWSTAKAPICVCVVLGGQMVPDIYSVLPPPLGAQKHPDMVQ